MKKYEPGVVTVIIAKFNRSSLLKETMRSVVEQTYRPIELIVVDDGSTDDTASAGEDFCRVHGGDDFGVRYLRQAHLGAPAARNLGLIESRGEFIQFLDSDDLIHPEKLACQADKMRQEPDVDFVYSHSARFRDAPDWDAAPYCGCYSPSPLPRCLAEFLHFWRPNRGFTAGSLRGRVGR